MATAKQIAANRANAKRSTGPKTLAGRLKSSRNALRHGLSRPMVPDAAASAMLETLECAIMASDDNKLSPVAAREFGEAQLELMRIRAVRFEALKQLAQGKFNPSHLRRLSGLDRYEQLAHTKRRRAAHKL
jgi:hypothetical protein